MKLAFTEAQKAVCPPQTDNKAQWLHVTLKRKFLAAAASRSLLFLSDPNKSNRDYLPYPLKWTKIRVRQSWNLSVDIPRQHFQLFACFFSKTDPASKIYQCPPAPGFISFGLHKLPLMFAISLAPQGKLTTFLKSFPNFTWCLHGKYLLFVKTPLVGIFRALRNIFYINSSTKS